MKFLGVALACLLVTISWRASAQSAEFRLIGEGNGEVIKLGWLPKMWPAGTSGVKIQKRLDHGDWILLTADEIYPAVELTKSLNNVEPSAAERERLQQKLKDLMDQGKLKPNSRATYQDVILADPKNLPMLAFAFATDYELMLLNGFGFIERDIPSGQDLEYGVFPVLNGSMSAEPVATFAWLSGTKPDNQLAMTGSMEVIGNKKSLLLKWEFDAIELKAKQLKGFNIYQIIGEGKIKLNGDLIWVTSGSDPATLTRKIPYPEGKEKVSFVAVPVSYFETEAQANEIVFDPAKYAINLTPPVLSAQSGSAAVLLTWSLGPGASAQLVGLEVQRKAAGQNYETIASLKATDNRYEDVSVEAGQYYFYRLVAVPQAGLAKIWSNEVVLQQLDNSLPATPMNLKGEIVQENGTTYARLTWDHPQTNQEIQFRIFIDSPFGDLAHDASIDPITGSTYDFEIKKTRSDTYHFAVQAMTADRQKSELSNQVAVVSPSSKLPPISIWPIEKVDNDVIIYWDYSTEIADLSGFRVYQNGALVADESVVSRTAKNHRLRNLSAGNYQFTIEAVTQFGGVSTRSKAINMTVD